MDEPTLTSHVKAARERAGLSQLALAERVGVSRQALIAIEAGRQVPSTRLGLQLARALHCGVDDLFQLEDGGDLEAELAPDAGAAARSAGRGSRVVLGRLNGRWVAHPIASDAALAADAVLLGHDCPKPGSPVRVEPLSDPAALEDNVLVAGCAPLLGLLAQRAGLRHRGARFTWLAAHSARALDLLDAGLVHVAGLHRVDGTGGEGNLPFLRKRFPQRDLQVVHLTRWRQGFLVSRGNPLGIREAGDLLRPDLRVARREPGAGASLLVRRLLSADGAGKLRVRGPMAAGHSALAQLVQCGAADVGVAIESAALAAGLDFVPLSEERFDLVVPSALLRSPAVARLVELLGGRTFRTEASHLPGYDVALAGQIQPLGAA